MKTMFKAVLGAASASALLSAVPAFAQSKTPAAVIVVIDTQRVSNECNACKTAGATLKSQIDAFQSRAQTLQTQIQTEGQSLQTAANALNGKQPDAALQQRITAFQQKQVSAQNELQKQEQTIQRNRAYVNQQINDKLEPIFSQVMQAHGANLALDVQATLATSNTVDVTPEVLASLNRTLTTINTTAPAAAATPGR